MFIIRFFTGSIIGIMSGIVLSVVGLILLFGVALGALAATGGPGACTPGGGPVAVDQANSDSFKQKWRAFNDTLASGGPAQVTFNESELTSRAKTYLDEHNTPFKNVRVCLHDGYGEASATIALLGIDSSVKLKGTLDLTGTHPKARLDQLDIGNVPGWLTGPAEAAVNRALDSVLNDVNLDHRYTLTLTPGQVTVSGQP